MASDNLNLAAHQFPQFHFHRSHITAVNHAAPSYLTHLAAFPLPQPAQEALTQGRALPSKIDRTTARHHLIAAVSSEPSIKLYNYSLGAGAGARIEHFAELRGHTKAIHDIKFHNVHGSYDTAMVDSANGACMLSSCSQDATVKFWDVRQTQPAITFNHPRNKPFISCASAGNLLAAGSESFLLLWDLRSPGNLLCENEEFHTEDINQIAFHPLDPSVIFTGAEDGLICVIKPEGGDQDDWLQNVLNIENPLSRMGFFGPQAEYMWALSCVETLSLWNIEECERVSDFSQIRDNLSVAARMPIDYLIDAHYDQSSRRVFLATGTNSGDLVLAHVMKKEIQPFCLAHVANRPTKDEATAAAAASSSSQVSALTGFAIQPMTNASPFALVSLKQTAPAPAAAAAAGEAMDADDEESEAAFLKDGEVIMNGNDGAGMDDSEEPAPLVPLDARAEGHTATIRDMLWFDNVVITAAEDSRICVWGTEASGQGASGSSSLKVKQHSATGAAAAANPADTSSPPAPDNSNKNNRQFRPY